MDAELQGAVRSNAPLNTQIVSNVHPEKSNHVIVVVVVVFLELSYTCCTSRRSSSAAVVVVAVVVVDHEEQEDLCRVVGMKRINKSKMKSQRNSNSCATK